MNYARTATILSSLVATGLGVLFVIQIVAPAFHDYVGDYEGYVLEAGSATPIDGTLVLAQWDECAGFGHCNSFCVHSELTNTDKQGYFTFKAWSNDAPRIFFYKLGYSTAHSLDLGEVRGEFRFLEKADITRRKYRLRPFTGTPEERVAELGRVSIDCSARDENKEQVLDVYDHILAELKQYHALPSYRERFLRLCGEIGYMGAKQLYPYPTEAQISKYLKANRQDCMAAAVTYKDKDAFIKAVERNDVPAMKPILDMGLDPDHDLWSDSALVLAAERGHVEAAKLLLDYGANPNNIDRKGKSALSYAILSDAFHGKKKAEIVALLMERGGDPNNKEPDDLTPFLRAIQTRDARVVQAMIISGVDPTPAYKRYGKDLDLHDLDGPQRYTSISLEDLVEDTVNRAIEPVALSDAPVRGEIKGHPFSPDRVELRDNVLKFSQGGRLIPDIGVEIGFHFLGYETLEKENIHVDYTVFRKPKIVLRWRDGSRVQWKHTRIGYALDIELGEEKDYQLPGRIALVVPGYARLSGTFTAKTSDIVIKDGKVDLTQDGSDTLHYVAKTFLEKLYKHQAVEIVQRISLSIRPPNQPPNPPDPSTVLRRGSVKFIYQVAGSSDRGIADLDLIRDAAGWKVSYVRQPDNVANTEKLISDR